MNNICQKSSIVKLVAWKYNVEINLLRSILEVYDFYNHVLVSSSYKRSIILFSSIFFLLINTIVTQWNIFCRLISWRHLVDMFTDWNHIIIIGSSLTYFLIIQVDASKMWHFHLILNKNHCTILYMIGLLFIYWYGLILKYPLNIP